MATTSGQIVGKLCEAQVLLHQAANAVIEARLKTHSLTDLRGAASKDFRGMPLDRHLDTLAEELTDRALGLDSAIKDMAALIDAPPAVRGDH